MIDLSILNDQQRQAVTAPFGPTLVLAGPGSGKTRVLTYRIAFLVDDLNMPPSDLMAVTFTNKAAREMAARVGRLLESKPGAGRINLGTFHALCARLLRQEADQLPVTRDYVIYDESDQRALVRQALKDLNLDPKQMRPARVLGAISQAKNELMEWRDLDTNSYFAEVTRRVYERYQALLIANNALDFDDLLFWVVRLLRADDDLRLRYQRRFPHLLVDEFQDTNSAQYALLRLLCGPEPDVFAVGDPDQSIYRWRGADYRNVLRFQKDFPQAKTFLLEQNYRSTQTILDIAMAVIDRNPNRKAKRLFTGRPAGPPAVLHEAYDENDEAQFVVETIALLTGRGEADPGDCAVMYRTNAQSRALEEAFLRAGLPYRLVGAQRFYGRREIKDIIAYLRLVHNPLDSVSLLRILNTPPRGLGDKTVATLLETARARREAPAELVLALARGEGEQAAERFTARALRGLTHFGEMLAEWREGRETLPLVDLMDRILQATRYRDFIDDGTDEGADRWANIEELRAAALDFSQVGLTSFLEHLALVSDQDTLTDALNAPTLLTLHAAKGLEFPVVLMIGLDDGVLPHQRSFEDPEAMAEERRLFYVGVTRAKDRLFLVRTFRRRVIGTSTLTEPSRFLADLPPDRVQGDLTYGFGGSQLSYQRQTTWSEDLRPPAVARFQAGMRVRHSKFGEGVVLETQLDHDDEEVTVKFEEAGVKHLAASMATLEVLDG